MMKFLQKLGKSLMLPVAVLPICGLLMGIGYFLCPSTMQGGTVEGLAQIIGFLLVKAGGALIDNMQILFVIGVAVGMADEPDGTPALAGLASWLMVQQLLSTGVVSTIMPNVVEGTTEYLAFSKISNPFIGILCGLIGAFAYNRFKNTQLPDFLAFFSGKRFVPIMIVVTIPLVAIAMYFIWPLFNMVINGFGNLLAAAGAFGTFIYGFLERLLIPTGLHHILNQLIRFTPIGGTAMIDGEQVSGALNIFNQLLMSSNPDMDTMREATRFLTQGTHPFMVFGLPAACFAMYKTAYPQNRQKVKGILLAAGLTSFLTGITEPIEFAFFFISPLLWLFHAVMAGLSFFINTLLGVCIGNAGGGLVDLMLFGVLRGPETKWYINVAIGLVYAVIYFLVFRWAIVKFNIKTPGREDESDRVSQSVEVTELGAAILSAIGGTDNVVEIDNCISRLRLILKDTSLVDEAALKPTGALGLIRINETACQIVYGSKVEKAAAELKRAVKSHT